jgi:hypothetical protein
MMEIIKRRAFEVGLAAIVGVIVLAVGLGTWLTYGSASSRLRTTLNTTKTQAQTLLQSTLFSEDLVASMKALVDDRKTAYDKLLNYVKGESAKRKPLVDKLFPKSTDPSLLMATKSRYDEELSRFMKIMRAVKPVLEPVPSMGPEKMRMSEASRTAMMFADVKRSFTRPEWVDQPQAPALDSVRVGQENLWLMEDLVNLIAITNSDLLARIKVTDKTARDEVPWAPIKELIEIRIGADAAVLAGTKMTPGSGRYRPAGASRLGKGGPTLSGRMSVQGFYNVLPFRIGLVVDARYCGEVVRHLKDRESFITVEAWKASPLATDAQFAKIGRDLSASSLDDYGPPKEGDRIVKRDALVRMEIVGESLAWTLEGGRVTAQVTSTPTGTAAAAPTPPK